MKKIALLFTILCAGALNGMEPERMEPERDSFLFYGQLPPELRALIIMSVNTYSTLDNIVNTIKAASVTSKEINAIVNEKYGNLAGFTALIGALEEKFPGITRAEIAKKFGTSIADLYIDLGNILVAHCKNTASTDGLINIINDGADVNFSTMFSAMFSAMFEEIEAGEITPLFAATNFLDKNKIDLLKVLLEKGANPHFKNSKFGIARDGMLRFIEQHADNADAHTQNKIQTAKIMIELLEEAMKK